MSRLCQRARSRAGREDNARKTPYEIAANTSSAEVGASFVGAAPAFPALYGCGEAFPAEVADAVDMARDAVR
jgi:hypothetical protein